MSMKIQTEIPKVVVDSQVAHMLLLYILSFLLRLYLQNYVNRIYIVSLNLQHLCGFVLCSVNVIDTLAPIVCLFLIHGRQMLVRYTTQKFYIILQGALMEQIYGTTQVTEILV